MRNNRTFVAPELNITSWHQLQPFFTDLEERDLSELSSFKKWMHDKSELDAVIEEDLAWRYIRMTINTADEKLSEAYSFFIENILPNIAPIEDTLNKKMISSPYVNELEKETAYFIHFRAVRKSIELYREENIPLETEIQGKSKQYGSISAKQSILWEGKELTMQQASNLLKDVNPERREKAFKLIAERRSQDSEGLENLFDELIQLRHQTAINAGFKNFRDYKLESMGRFDYGLQECLDFHEAIKEVVVPLARKYQAEHAAKLGKKTLKPWDTEVDPEGKAALKPFETGAELLQKSQQTFYKVDDYFGDCLVQMEKMKHLDLESKSGKAPGGYNYPLYESGVPFIFMNAVGSQRDLVTMIHEGGHAVHSFLSKDLSLTAFKNLTSEIAELASMSMELLTMDHWNEFYSDENEEKRAKREHLLDILKVLPWIATIDSFQHWIYENPNHTRLERKEKWQSLLSDYGNPLVDWSGFENVKNYSWHRQLHLFEVPFYYIEYGIAQLGALGVWKNSKTDQPAAIK
ncbi:MAG: M3 family oligoendopeptidase, partial [Bacteroidetes bacterium]|nr:M3 family oligoendopeptidase [Bacteroidota bacterium]